MKWDQEKPLVIGTVSDLGIHEVFTVQMGEEIPARALELLKTAEGDVLRVPYGPADFSESRVKASYHWSQSNKRQPEWIDFETRCKAVGLTARDCGNGHWRIEGGVVEVNYYPYSRNRSIYVNGTTHKITIHNGDGPRAIRAALEPPKKIPRKCQEPRDSPKMKKILKKLLARSPRCHWCRKNINISAGPRDNNRATIDHLIPLSRGGTHGADNMVAACYPCNQERGSNIEAPESPESR